MLLISGTYDIYGLI